MEGALALGRARKFNLYVMIYDDHEEPVARRHGR